MVSWSMTGVSNSSETSKARLVMGEDEFFDRRYRQIRDFEEYLWENGYRLLKVFLNVGPDEQRKRLLERIDDESKNWKFSASDIAERQLWPKYMHSLYDHGVRVGQTIVSPGHPTTKSFFE